MDLRNAYMYSFSFYCKAEPYKRVSMTTFGSRFKHLLWLKEKPAFADLRCLLTRATRGYSPLQVVAELVLSFSWVYIEDPTQRITVFDLYFRYDGILQTPIQRKQLTPAVFRYNGKESGRRYSKSWFSFTVLILKMKKIFNSIPRVLTVWL